MKTEMKKSEFGNIINSLTEIATQEVKSTGVCTIPGVCRIKWRMKPALKPKKRKVFGKVVIVKARLELIVPVWYKRNNKKELRILFPLKLKGQNM